MNVSIVMFFTAAISLFLLLVFSLLRLPKGNYKECDENLYLSKFTIKAIIISVCWISLYGFVDNKLNDSFVKEDVIYTVLEYEEDFSNLVNETNLVVELSDDVEYSQIIVSERHYKYLFMTKDETLYTLVIKE